MGTNYVIQGKCIVCGYLTHDRCDSCCRYICDEHRQKRPAVSGRKVHIFCEECFNKRKKALDP